MSAMVMCPENAPSAAMFQRYPSPPVTYPFNNFAAYNTSGPGAPHAQQPEYGQFHQMSDPSVQQAWYSAMYGARPEEWGYPANTSTAALSSPPPGIGQYSYRSGGPMGIDYSQAAPAGGHMVQSSSDSPGDTSSSSSSAGSPSNKQLRPPYDWMKKQTFQSAPTNGKTRTKDKYRVVYSDHQRLELEKEFHYSRYITIRRKAELAQALALSERQVKIWFQNRRAKERKQNKKRGDDGSKFPGDLDLQDDNKQHVQQHMNIHMAAAHAQQQQQQQVPVNSSPTPPMHHGGQNQYSMQHATPTHPGQGHGQGHGQGQHMSSPEGVVSPHIVHQYSSAGQMQIPVSPINGHDAVSPSATSPVTVKSDVDANDVC